jgi:putative tryptophan/tyrosine transport system substrate-binding protein
MQYVVVVLGPRVKPMRRREFIAVMGSAAVAWPLAARAQQAGKVPRVGILSPAANEAATTLITFRKAIRDLGYVEGETVIIDFRLSKGNLDALPELALQLVHVPVAVIVTDTTSATQAAASATRTIPIVMASSGGDPVALGWAASLNKPGGNVTGALFLSIQLNAKRLQLLRLAFPDIKRVTALFNPTSAIGPPGLRAIEEAAKLLGIAISPLAVSNPDELRALAPATLAGSGGLIVAPDGMFWNYRAVIIALASAARIPALYPEREYADDGGLIAYGANVPDHFRQAAGYVDRILRGEKAGDLPINASSKLDFVVNLRTAHALGLAISPDFQSSANEVIE